MTEADREALADAMGEAAPTIAADVAEGRSWLIRYADGSRIVLRLERHATGRELVIVAGAGQDAPGKVEGWRDAAIARGWGIRFHTARPALGRMLEGLGFTESERVYRYGRQ